MSKYRKLLIGVFLTGVVIALGWMLGGRALSLIAGALVQRDAPLEADAVVAVDDPGLETVRTAAALVEAGYAPYAVVSGRLVYGVSTAAMGIERAAGTACPRGTLVPVTADTDSYQEQCTAILRILRGRNARTVILVAHEFDTRAWRRLFHSRAADLKLRSVAISSPIRCGNWWRTPLGRQRLFVAAVESLFLW